MECTKCEKIKISPDERCDCRLTYQIEKSFRQQEEIDQLTKENEELEKQLSEIKDTCEKCGCTEFLCGHNARG